ncbi:hypothetical protein BU24DRAFT_417170 [Aaosphaeria arxii CBS 175.79]|uniref:Haloacid dehalogenase n=1 Tax=Aaosphaeria arxii CBS 175.79 TaxID=1450172 RepID=A0A6A5Y9U9_9PLEO|nr:uncharacterized protein BU24DRAFT_417170 [Aaosphaeria arxii CBS 175.79]KAF2021531.1 hypothetical protein BU24DRAFT_417170 [Aaosphaeria arxii CBS 175.79]
MVQKRNLLLAFDAFGTLFAPKKPIPEQYGYFAALHGIEESQWKTHRDIMMSFGKAFKDESRKNPNYGRATGLGAEKWWANVITKTFDPFLKPGQQVPQALVTDLLTQFSTDRGYSLFPDVIPFFQMLRNCKSRPLERWKWDRTVVGIVTNSDDRVPGILQSFGLEVGNRRFDIAERVIANSQEDIDFVILSYDVGYEKPDRPIFDAAVESLKQMLAKESQGQSIEDFEKLYVGDEYEKDYVGAKNAGWNAIRLDRNLPESDARSINDLSHLEQWTPMKKI